MCSVKPVEVPTIEFTFYLDECPCLPVPREMVEYWQPGQRASMTTVRAVAEAQQMPGLWAALSESYSAWRHVPLLTYEPDAEWPASLRSSKTLQIA